MSGFSSVMKIFKNKQNEIIEYIKNIWLRK